MKGKINICIITGKNINLIYLETTICPKFSVYIYFDSVGKKPYQKVIASIKPSLETVFSLQENILVKIGEGNS